MTTRDFAKFGLLFARDGEWGSERIIPEDWVLESTAPTITITESWQIGYGYQWWLPGDPLTDYTAHGVYNQFIYVDPESGIVIAKTSSNHRFRSEKEYTKDAHIAMFRSIAQHIKKETN